MSGKNRTKRAKALASQVARVLRREREKRGLSLNALGEQAGLFAAND